jgi:hypothetical protein
MEGVLRLNSHIVKLVSEICHGELVESMAYLLILMSPFDKLRVTPFSVCDHPFISLVLSTIKKKRGLSRVSCKILHEDGFDMPFKKILSHVFRHNRLIFFKDTCISSSELGSHLEAHMKKLAEVFIVFRAL